MMLKFLMFTLALVMFIGCKTEEEKIREKQIEVCEEGIKSGQEPTPFCINLLPQYRSMVPQNVPQVAQQPSGEYVPEQPYVEQNAPQGGYPVQPVVQQPQYVPVPVQQAPVVQNGSTTADTIRDMAIGGMIGHAMGSNNNNNNNGSNYRDDYRPRYNVTKNVTVINRPVAPPVQGINPTPVPKKNYMDMNKLAPYGARPSTPVSKPTSSMNMNKLSTYGSRPSTTRRR